MRLTNECKSPSNSMSGVWGQTVVQPIAVAKDMSDDNQGIVPDFSLFTRPRELMEDYSVVQEQTPCILTQKEQHDLALHAVREGTNQILRTDAAIFKKKIFAETDLDTYEKKQIIKARHKEMEKSQVQDFVFAEDGTPIVETKDVRFDLPSRRFTNLKRPKIITYVCPESEQTCYCLLCMVGDKVRRVYFLESKIGKYAYVSRKCMAAGIYFEYNPVSRMKEMVLKFMAQLISWCEDTVELPYDTGWYYDGDGELCYANEEELTWKDVLKRAE